jgi:hypothetical protein
MIAGTTIDRGAERDTAGVLARAGDAIGRFTIRDHAVIADRDCFGEVGLKNRHCSGSRQ